VRAAKASSLKRAEPPGARRVLRRLARLWAVPGVATLTVVERATPRGALGRYVVGSKTVELSPTIAAEEDTSEVLTHEAAHAALSLGSHGTPPAPHGREWRALMARAGYSDARASLWRGCLLRGEPRPKRGRAPSARWVHSCPVCHFSRVARRPVRAWRCAACVAAGLPGRLEITRLEGDARGR
jgi:hypothetical protein